MPRFARNDNTEGFDMTIRKSTAPGLFKILFNNAFLSILMFLFIYNISFLAAPSLTTGRFVIIALMIALFSRVYKESLYFVRENWFSFFIFAFVLFYSLVLYIFNGRVDNTQFSRSFHFLLYSIFGFLLFSTLLKHDLYKFVSIFSLATLIQSLFIIYSYISPEYREWLSNLLVQGGNIPLSEATQVPGFSNSSGALLSVIQALGVFSALYAGRLSRSLHTIYFYIFIAIINMASTIVVARTGFFLSIAFFVLFFIITIKKERRALIVGTVAVLVVIYFSGSRLYTFISDYNPKIEYLGNWVSGFFQQGTQEESLKELLTQHIPPLTFETLVGTGLVVEGEVNASGNDSGYIQTYYAIGLIIALAFYMALLGILIKYIYLSKDRLLFGTLVLCMFIVEIKEPFIFKYTYPFFVFSLIFISSKHRRFHKITQDVMGE